MSAHTPGPWEWSLTSAGYAISATLMDRVGTPEIVLAESYESIDIVDAEANARLIAAAPELLDALKKAQAFIDDLLASNPNIIGRSVLQDYKRFNEALIEIPAAIAKAAPE